MKIEEFRGAVLEVFGEASNFDNITMRTPIHSDPSFMYYNAHFTAEVVVKGQSTKLHLYDDWGLCRVWAGDDDYGFRNPRILPNENAEIALRVLHCFLNFGYSQCKMIYYPDGTVSGPIFGTSYLDLHGTETVKLGQGIPLEPSA